MQVVAYLEVTPDIMPAKIYVNETAQALQGFMEPLSQIHHQSPNSNCSDLLNRVVLAGKHVFSAQAKQLLHLASGEAGPVCFHFRSVLNESVLQVMSTFNS